MKILIIYICAIAIFGIFFTWMSYADELADLKLQMDYQINSSRNEALERGDNDGVTFSISAAF